MASTIISQATTPRLPNRQIIRRKELAIIKRASIINSKQDDSVDENMVVLRMRIKKMKVLEGGKGGEVAAPPPPSDWKEWEKKLFTHYHEGVCDFSAMLQTYLMNARPSVALGVMALAAITLPLSSTVVMTNFLKLARGLLAGSHVCIDIDF